MFFEMVIRIPKVKMPPMIIVKIWHKKMQSAVNILLFIFGHKKKTTHTEHRDETLIEYLDINIWTLHIMIAVHFKSDCIANGMCSHLYMYLCCPGWLHQTTRLHSPFPISSLQMPFVFYFHSMVLAFAIMHSKPLLNWNRTKERKQIYLHTGMPLGVTNTMMKCIHRKLCAWELNILFLSNVSMRCDAMVLNFQMIEKYYCYYCEHTGWEHAFMSSISTTRQLNSLSPYSRFAKLHAHLKSNNLMRWFASL